MDQASRIDLESRGNSGVGWVAWLLIVGYVVFAAVSATRNRVWDWDVLAYTGCVEELHGGTPEEVHEAVYAQLEEHAPRQANEDLRSRNEYRARLASDPEAFSAQLPFYRGRVLPIALLAGFDRLGVSPIQGAFGLSFLSGLVIALVFLFWVSRYVAFSPIVAASALWLLLCDWSTTLAMATPDTLAAALIVAGVFLLLETRYLFPALILLGLSLATRADHVIFVGPLLALRYFHPLHGRALSIRALVTTLILYAGVVLLCTKGRDTYGWWTVFHHTFVEYKIDPVAQTPALDLGFWFERTVGSLPMFKAWEPLLTTLVALTAIGVGFWRARWRSRGAGLAAAALIGVGVHFIIFPALWPRLFLAHWTLIGIGLLLAGTERTRAPRAVREPGQGR